MADQKIIDYIKSQRDLRIQDPTIIATLLKAGYPQADIDEGFKLLDMTQGTEIPVSQVQKAPPLQGAPSAPDDQDEKPGFKLPFKMPGRTFFVILTALLVIIIGVSIFVFIQSRSAEQEEVPEDIQVEEEEEPAEEPTPEVVEEISSTPTELTPEQKDEQRMKDITAIQDALEKYFADNSAYPDNLNKLYTTYLDKIIVDPVTFLPYDYFVREEGQSYVICVTPEGQTNRQCAEKGRSPFGSTTAPTQ